MSSQERLGACGLGVALSGVGATAVFLTQNQAGSTAMILVGAVFLLVGIQGTPISRASKDAIELRDREVTQQAKELVETEGAVEAERYLQGAVSADPRLLKTDSVSEMGFELWNLRLKQSLERIASTNDWIFTKEAASYDSGRDYMIECEDPPLGIQIVVKYIQAQSRVRISKQSFLKSLRRAFDSIDHHPILIITNILPISLGQLDKAADNIAGTVVKWSNEEDDESVKDAIDDILALVS